MQTEVDLLLAGHITIDCIVADGKENLSTGGAVYYGAFPAALTGARVGVLTRLARDDRSILDEFGQADIPVMAKEGKFTSRIKTIPRSADFEKRTFIVESQADPFKREDFDAFEARIIMLCPLMKGEMPLEVIQGLENKAELGLDVQGFIRCLDGNRLRSADWDRKVEGLAGITYLKTDKRETEVLTGLNDMHAAVEELARLGPREILCTHSDGIFLWANGDGYSVRFSASQTSGRTGRGDTTFATYLAKRLNTGPEESLAWTAALVSRKLERPGPFKGPVGLIEQGLPAHPVVRSPVE
jgi:sugar/nucleoside kinase (ribokinase family)